MSNTRALFIGAILSSTWPGGEPKVAKSITQGFIRRGVRVQEVGFRRPSSRFNNICSIVN